MLKDPCYAIVRIGLDRSVPGIQPDIVVKCVVDTLEFAESETKRLNELNADKGYTYFWQYTRHVYKEHTEK